MGVANPIYRHISSYSFIFSTDFFVFFTCSFIFLHISSYFLHTLNILSTYIFIFPSYSFIFSTYFFIFLHIFHTFLHISFISTRSRNSRIWRHQGEGTRKSWNYPIGPGLEIFPSPLDIFWMWRHQGGWRGCTRKSLYYLTGHKTWNMSIWRKYEGIMMEQCSEFFYVPEPRRRRIFLNNYFFIFSSYIISLYFPHISSYFPHIPSYFSQISSYLGLRKIPCLPGSGGGSITRTRAESLGLLLVPTGKAGFSPKQSRVNTSSIKWEYQTFIFSCCEFTILLDSLFWRE